jgi:hypothetical protein
MSLFCSVVPFPPVSFRLLAFTLMLQFSNISGGAGPRSAVLSTMLYTAAAHLHAMGDAELSSRVMVMCARLQYATPPQPDITCALGAVIAAQGGQHDLIAHAPSPAVFAHGLHALRAAAALGIALANGSRSSPAPNILAMTLKQYGSAARCVNLGAPWAEKCESTAGGKWRKHMRRP